MTERYSDTFSGHVLGDDWRFTKDNLSDILRGAGHLWPWGLVLEHLNTPQGRDEAGRPMVRSKEEEELSSNDLDTVDFPLHYMLRQWSMISLDRILWRRRCACEPHIVIRLIEVFPAAVCQPSTYPWPIRRNAFITPEHYNRMTFQLPSLPDGCSSFDSHLLMTPLQYAICAPAVFGSPAIVKALLLAYPESASMPLYFTYSETTAKEVQRANDWLSTKGADDGKSQEGKDDSEEANSSKHVGPLGGPPHFPLHAFMDWNHWCRARYYDDHDMKTDRDSDSDTPSSAYWKTDLEFDDDDDVDGWKSEDGNDDDEDDDDDENDDEKFGGRGKEVTEKMDVSREDEGDHMEAQKMDTSSVGQGGDTIVDLDALACAGASEESGDEDELDEGELHHHRLEAETVQLMLKLFPQAAAMAVTATDGRGLSDESDCKYEDSVHGRGIEGMLPLHQACRHGAPPRIIRLLCDAHPDGIDARNGRGETPLDLACSGRATERSRWTLAVIEELIERRLRRQEEQPEAKSGDNQDEGEKRRELTPLHRYCYHGRDNPKVVRSLLKAFPDGASNLDGEGRLPLHLLLGGFDEDDLHRYGDDRPYVRAYGVRTAAEVLLSSYPEALYVAKDGKAGTSVMETLGDEATRLLSQDELLALAHPSGLDQPYGGSKNANDGQGLFPLHMACRNGVSSQVLSMVHGGFPDAAKAWYGCGQQRRLPLHLACEWIGGVEVETVQLLVDAFGGAIVEQDGLGRQPFVVACLHGGTLDALYYLLTQHPGVIKAATVANANATGVISR